MRKLRFQAEDSLDLLLDTLCNVFGSIILISCLLALVSGPEPVAAPPGEGAAMLAARQALERRIAAAEEEVKGLKELKDKLTGDDQAKLAALNAELEELRKTQDRLRADKEHAMKPTDDSKPPSGPSEQDLAELRRQVREAEQRITNAAMQKNAAELTEKELRQRLAKLKEQLSEEKQGQHVEVVRFPKEHDTKKNPMAVLLKHGEVFPVYDAEGNRFPGLVFKDLPGDDEATSVDPQSGKGLRIGRDLMVLRRLLATAKRGDLYAAIYLFPDSFEQMRALRPLLDEAGIDFGFEIVPQYYLLTFSKTGSRLKQL